LRDETTQEIRLAVEQPSQRLGTHRIDAKIAQAAARIADAAGPAPRVAGMALGKTPGCIARRKKIRAKGLI
jgi:hypothetical protein